MNDKIVQLPVSNDVPIKIYKNYAYPLSIICSDKLNDKWFYEHFLNIYLMRNKRNYIWLDFLEPENCFKELLNVSHIELSELFKYDIIELIKQTLSKGEYVTTFLK